MSLRALSPNRPSMFPTTSHRSRPASGRPGSGTSLGRTPQKCPLHQRSLAGTTPKNKHNQTQTHKWRGILCIFTLAQQQCFFCLPVVLFPRLSDFRWNTFIIRTSQDHTSVCLTEARPSQRSSRRAPSQPLLLLHLLQVISRSSPKQTLLTQWLGADVQLYLSQTDRERKKQEPVSRQRASHEQQREPYADK